MKPFLALRGIEKPGRGPAQARESPVVRERARTLVDAAFDLDFYFREPPEFDEKAQKKFLTPAAAPHLAALGAVFEAAPAWKPNRSRPRSSNGSSSSPCR